MKILLIGIAIFCAVHIYRDYLQIKGVKNWFTQFGHFWDVPKLEAPIAVIIGIVGLICLYFAFK
jgi:formate hydrogenlyase subunit 3/multisubunit Na+/H+ antiporter MnhD subunit